MERLDVGRELTGRHNYFVIPAQAGTQAVPRQSVSTHAGASRPAQLGVPPGLLTAGLGAAWVPAFAGMTE